jgi:mono/diheme cytochrome c family protein
MRSPRSWIPLGLLALTCAGAGAEPTRGQLLYETHCIACHSTQMHWRDKRSATDWASLLAQVRQWQAREQLRWADTDIDAVATYLNETIYRLPPAAIRGE